MSKKVLIFAAIALGFSASNLQAAQIPCSWIGPDNGLWGDPCNWDCGIVPDNNASQTFVVSITNAEVTLAENWTVDKLDCYGEVELNTWTDWAQLTLADTNGLTNHGDLSIEGKWHDDINGKITNTGSAELYLEDLEIAGDLFNPDGSIMGIKGKIDTDEGNFENSGLIQIAPGSEFYIEEYVHNNGQIKIYGGAFGSDDDLVNNPLGIVEGFGVFRASQLLQNKGTIYAEGGTLTIAWFEEATLLNSGVLGNTPGALLNIKSEEEVNNTGTIEVNAGGGITFDCNLVNEPNGVIQMYGGTLAATNIIQSANATFKGQGDITGNLTIESNSLIALTGPTNIFGDVNIPVDATLEISDGQTLITGHTTCDGTIRLIGGTVIFQGGCDCEDCTITHEAGTGRNHFDINEDGTVNFDDFAAYADNWLWQASWY